ncbi:MAG: molybdopterin-synthase adenylyltransferase MoeB [Bacteroidota bacterium]
MLKSEEKIRYDRHLKLPNFGLEGQLALRAARVLVVGAGGLGCPVLQYLTAAGVGTIGIVDGDRVSLSNLQRQVLYGRAELGQCKVDAAAAQLHNLNANVKTELHAVHLTTDNALDIIKPYDLVVDATDNFPTRYLVNDACVLLDKPCVYGSIYRFEGQVSVFNAQLADGKRSPNYRDLYPTPPPPAQVPNCAEGGVLGVLPGIIGAMQANEAIKILSGIGELLAGKLWVFDAAYGQVRTFRYRIRSTTNIAQLIDYEQFCGVPKQEAVPSVDVITLRSLSSESYHLLDVRTASEVQLDQLGGQHIPLDELPSRIGEIAGLRPLIVLCQSGQRSNRAVQLLQAEGLQEVYNLEGGLNAYREHEIK